MPIAVGTFESRTVDGSDVAFHVNVNVNKWDTVHVLDWLTQRLTSSYKGTLGAKSGSLKEKPPLFHALRCQDFRCVIPGYLIIPGDNTYSKSSKHSTIIIRLRYNYTKILISTL